MDLVESGEVVLAPGGDGVVGIEDPHHVPLACGAVAHQLLPNCQHCHEVPCPAARRRQEYHLSQVTNSHSNNFPNVFKERALPIF